MLTFLSIFIGVFLIALGLVAIYLGIRTYIHLCSAKLTTGGDMVGDQPFFFSHVLTEADAPIYIATKPLCTLACMTVIGLLPLSFGILLFVRIVGIF
jgi:hypothetical protein